MAKPPTLRDYVFVDHQRIDSYLDQLEIPLTEEGKRTWKVGLSLTGPSYESEVSPSDRELSIHEKIVTLRETLDRRGLLAKHRPDSMTEVGRGATASPFVWETTQAVRVVMSPDALRRVPGLKGLAVWVSDPDWDDLDARDRTKAGTFVYLTETYIDEAGFQTVFSGCSALQALANVASGRPFLTQADGEPLGGGSSLHPVQKLVSLGGQAGDARSIESIYRLRYITDEQCCMVRGRERRVSDLVGYPLYIATPLGLSMRGQSPDVPADSRP